MHRSGTSFLSRKLDEMGIFQGYAKDVNNESLFFLKLNNWLLRQSDSSWSSPENFSEAIKEKRLENMLLSHIRFRINSVENISYYGAKNKFFRKNLEKWGWKDPRTTFTLPIWQKIYPDAKVLSIKRHGVDVASSLYKRSNRWINQHQKMSRSQQFKLKYYLGYSDSYKNLNLDHALNLWNIYETQVEKIKNSMSHSNSFMQIKYEDIPENKDLVLEKLLEFLEVPFSEKDIKKIQNDYKIDRDLAYKKSNTLNDFAKKNRTILKNHGY